MKVKFIQFHQGGFINTVERIQFILKQFKSLQIDRISLLNKFLDLKLKIIYDKIKKKKIKKLMSLTRAILGINHGNSLQCVKDYYLTNRENNTFEWKKYHYYVKTGKTNYQKKSKEDDFALPSFSEILTSPKQKKIQDQEKIQDSTQKEKFLKLKKTMSSMQIIRAPSNKKLKLDKKGNSKEKVSEMNTKQVLPPFIKIFPSWKEFRKMLEGVVNLKVDIPIIQIVYGNKVKKSIK